MKHQPTLARRVFCAGTGVAFAQLLSGCMLGPNYQRPTLSVPGKLPGDVTAGGTGDITSDWWKQWGDPVLPRLVDEALVANDDLLAATARVEQFYGALGVTRSQLFPQVGAGFDASRTRASEEGVSPAPAGNPYDAYQASLSLSWEIDFFGRIRRLSEAARAEALAAEDARRAVVLSVVSATVTGYVSLLDLDNRLKISRGTLESRTGALKLFERRFQGGVISEVELSQARTEYAQALAAVPQFEQAVAQQENALCVLLGRNPGPIERGTTIDKLAPKQVPAGLPSDLLERRPDLRRAENTLVAANARIGAAKALYFPRISLTGLFGYSSSSMGDLWNGSARTWTYAGVVTMPIFSAGAISGQVFASEGAQREAVANYRQAVRVAFQETDDALVGIRKTAQARDAQKLQVDGLRRYAYLARRKYEGGYTSYLEVLDAERTLFSAELSYSQSLGDSLRQQVALVKALGGTWVTTAEQAAPQRRVLGAQALP